MFLINQDFYYICPKLLLLLQPLKANCILSCKVQTYRGWKIPWHTFLDKVVNESKDSFQWMAPFKAAKKKFLQEFAWMKHVMIWPSYFEGSHTRGPPELKPRNNKQLLLIFEIYFWLGETNLKQWSLLLTNNNSFLRHEQRFLVTTVVRNATSLSSLTLTLVKVKTWPNPRSNQ